MPRPGLSEQPSSSSANPARAALVLLTYRNIGIDKRGASRLASPFVKRVMATRFASIPAEGRFEAIRSMEADGKMALLAGLVAMTVDGTVFAGGSPGTRHHHFEQIARASGVDIAARWSAPIGLFDKMRRAAMIELLREECGAPSAENCASIKKKTDLAVNVSGRLRGNWLPAPMKIGAFDQSERDPKSFDTDMDGDDIEGAEDDEMADDEMA